MARWQGGESSITFAEIVWTQYELVRLIRVAVEARRTLSTIVLRIEQSEMSGIGMASNVSAIARIQTLNNLLK
ncbi:MAG: hypothetical protein HP494_04475 [Nitrospira sp.]|nr:hypothetical protein [Nitrospira sp.]